MLRVLAQMAYHPAIIYIDTLKYLYDTGLALTRSATRSR